jgi:thiamine biosynthesis lipoprotein
MILVDKVFKAPFDRGFFYAFIFGASTLLLGCNPMHTVQGDAQGTTYTIKYFGDTQISKVEVDSILKQIDQSLSTWVPNSIISTFNGTDSMVMADVHFTKNLYMSYSIWRQTLGAFNPFIKPLVDYWGFGEKEQRIEKVDSSAVDSLLNLVSPSNIMVFSGDRYLELKLLKQVARKPVSTLIKKKQPNVKVDFNGIAQGYSVDVIAEYMTQKGIQNFLIELGGEMRASGIKSDGGEWSVGVDKPLENAPERSLEAVISLKDKSLATSGNYRKFYEIEGLKIHHTLNPSTGYPAKNDMLSATVMHTDCAVADAYATAFMVMGFEEAKRFIGLNRSMGMEAFFIYNRNGEIATWASEGMQANLK